MEVHLRNSFVTEGSGSFQTVLRVLSGDRSPLPPKFVPQCNLLNFTWFRGQKLNPNMFFSNFSGASGISRQNPGISRQKSLIPWVSRDIPNFLAPTPSRGRPPPHQKISGLKSLGLGSFFVPDDYTSLLPLLNLNLAFACDPPFPLQTPQTPENSKTQKSYSNVTFGLPAKVTQKLLKSDSKVTFWTVQKVNFESLLSSFWATLAGSPKVTFE